MFAKAKSSKRQNKRKGNFQEEFLDLKREHMVLQHEQEKQNNDLIQSIFTTQQTIEQKEQEKDRKFLLELGRIFSGIH